MRLLLRIVCNAAALALAATFVEGVTVSGPYAALIAAVVLGVLNALVRPLLIFLTLPVTVLTLGLFVFVINALMVWLMSSMVKGIEIDGFAPALMVALLLWIVGTLTNWLLVSGEEEK
jgi:putative membrane protein